MPVMAKEIERKARNNKMNAKISGIQHIGIPTKDMRATVEFYEKFGFCVAFEIVKSGKGHAEFE